VSSWLLLIGTESRKSRVLPSTGNTRDFRDSCARRGRTTAQSVTQPPVPDAQIGNRRTFQDVGPPDAGHVGRRSGTVKRESASGRRKNRRAGAVEGRYRRVKNDGRRQQRCDRSKWFSRRRADVSRHTGHQDGRLLRASGAPSRLRRSAGRTGAGIVVHRAHSVRAMDAATDRFVPVRHRDRRRLTAEHDLCRRHDGVLPQQGERQNGGKHAHGRGQPITEDRHWLRSR